MLYVDWVYGTVGRQKIWIQTWMRVWLFVYHINQTSYCWEIEWSFYLNVSLISGDALRTAVWRHHFFIPDGETDWRVRQITILEEWGHWFKQLVECSDIQMWRPPKFTLKQGILLFVVIWRNYLNDWMTLPKEKGSKFKNGNSEMLLLNPH